MSDTTESLATKEREGLPTPAKRRSRGRALLVVLILVLLPAAVYAYLRLSLAGFQSTDDASIAGNQVVVSAQILGRIRFMSAGEGKPVAKGEQIVTLDDASLRAHERQATANEELAGETVKLARIKLDQAESDEARGRLQFQNRIISAEQYDHLKAAAATASAGYAIALAQERLAAAQVGAAETELAHTRISSPIDGVVAKKWALPGDVVQPAQSIYTLVDLHHLWVVANFKETQLIHLAVGQPATITVDAVPGRSFSGRIESIGAGTASQFALIPQDTASGNFTKITQRIPVMISIEDRPSAGTRLLVPGMSAEVRVETGRE